VQQVRLRGRISAIRDVACEPPLKYHLLSQLALCTNAALGVEGALARQHATAFSVLGAASSPAKLKEKAAVGDQKFRIATRDRSLSVVLYRFALITGAPTSFFERSEKNRNVGLASVVRRLTDILATRRDERQ
jgi:hypothetical protein